MTSQIVPTGRKRERNRAVGHERGERRLRGLHRRRRHLTGRTARRSCGDALSVLTSVERPRFLLWSGLPTLSQQRPALADLSAQVDGKSPR